MAEILLCHAPEDQDAAQRLAERFDGHGLPVRLCNNNAQSTKQAIDAVPLTLVYWTRAGAKSDYVQDAAAHASRILRLIPISPDNTPNLDTWPLRAAIALLDSSENAVLHAAKIVAQEFRYSKSASLTFSQRLAFVSSRRGSPEPAPGKPGSFLFWRNLEPLSPETHGSLGVGEVEKPYAMLANTHLVPIVVGEFEAAARSYPIVFDIETKAPSIVMGIRPETNVFLASDGTADAEAYAPLFVRRYPFLPVAGRNGDIVMCIDRDARVITDRPVIPFFEKNGELSAYTKSAVESCKSYDAQQRQTAAFSRLMDELGCFETTSLIVPGEGPNDPPSKVGDYLRISQTALEALPAAKFAELRDNGAVRAAYAHLASQSQWSRLLSRARVLEAQSAN